MVTKLSVNYHDQDTPPFITSCDKCVNFIKDNGTCNYVDSDSTDHPQGEFLPMGICNDFVLRV